jgi:hypothetical protein
MKILVLVAALSALTWFESNSQNITFSAASNKRGEKMYLNGTKLVEIGKYKEADSLLTLALCSYKNENIYYNRGISRLYNADTSGFCGDMNTAANKYFDAGARQLFNTLCCTKVDSIYYDKKYLITDHSNYKYLEEIQHVKESGDIYGTIHQRNKKLPVETIDYGCEKNIVSMRTLTTDIIAVYQMMDSTKFYFKADNDARTERVNQYVAMKDEIASYFEIKYKSLKDINSADKITIYYELRVSDKGEIIDGKYIGIFPEISINGYEQEIAKDVKDILKRYPKVKPAKYRGENVNFRAYDFIEF